MFPCKPQINTRAATATEPARMGLAECKAGEWSFSLAWAELAEPQMVGPALLQMRQSLANKLQAPVDQGLQSLLVPGMTPNPQAQMQLIEGPQQQARIAVFARGLRVYQAVLLGKKASSEAGASAWAGFSSSLHLEE